MKKTIIFLFVLLIHLDLFSQNIHSPDEIVTLMTNSSTKYMCANLKKEIDCQDYSWNILKNDYYRIGDDKDLKIYKYKISDSARIYLETAEMYFAITDFKSALEYYKKSYESDTTTYFNLTFIGQCYCFLKKYDESIKYYKKAINNNYIDYMSHWFLADIYAGNENWKKAVKEITTAQILNRNNPRLKKALIDIYDKAGIEWNDFCFNPQLKLKVLGKDSVSVKFNLVWMMYAMTKAIWSYEKGYRESMGEKESQFSALEELESLSVLYQSLINAKKNFKDIPELVALEKSIKNNMLDAYILYEILLVKYPLTAYTLSNEKIDKLVEYVMKIRTMNN